VSSFATNVLSDIGTSGHAEQDLLDAIDTGSGCASEGQEAVIKTRAALTTAQDNLAKSTADLVSALNAKVSTCTAPVVDCKESATAVLIPSKLKVGQQHRAQRRHTR